MILNKIHFFVCVCPKLYYTCDYNHEFHFRVHNKKLNLESYIDYFPHLQFYSGKAYYLLFPKNL